MTLDEVFKKLPTYQVIQIDIKDSKDLKSCDTVKELIDKYQRHDSTIVGTTAFNTWDNIEEAFNGVKKPLYVMPVEHYLKYSLAFYFGLLPFLKLDYDVVSLPRISRDPTDFI